MTSRLEEGYRHRFRVLLAKVRPKRLEFGVDLLMARARAQGVRAGIPPAVALARLYEATRRRVHRRLEVMAACAVNAPTSSSAPPRFLCDGSLGGLARWLRASGYEAVASQESGDALLERAQAEGLTLVTTDSRVLRRRAVRDGTAAVVWLPSSATCREQLGMLMRDLGLPPQEPRCMACGGALRPVPKETVLNRIPPRTRAWKDDYFVCSGCDRLFWQGTHWERIRRGLAAAGPATPEEGPP